MTYKQNLFFAFMLSVFLMPTAQAFFTVAESGEITPVDKFKVGILPQVIVSDGGGTNFSGFFDVGFNEELSARAELGTGDTDFFAGGSLKWIPIPDYGQQPAFGGKLGAHFWNEGSESFFTLKLDPIVSKKFDTTAGIFIPYGSVPLIYTSHKSDSDFSIQVVGGSEYRHADLPNFTFGGELGLDAKDSFSYFAAYVTIYIDQVMTKGN